MGKFTKITTAACQRPEAAFFVVLYSVLAPWQWHSYWICWQTDYTWSCQAAKMNSKEMCRETSIHIWPPFFLDPNLWQAILADLYPLLQKSLRNSLSSIFLSVAVGSFKGWPFSCFWVVMNYLMRKRNIYLIYKHFNISTFNMMVTYALQRLEIAFFHL